MSLLRSAIDLSNYPESIDIDLHPQCPTTSGVQPGMLYVSKFQLDRLYEINQITVAENEHLRKENDQLLAKNRYILFSFEAKQNELKKEIDRMTNRYSQQVILMDQTMSHLRCYIKKLESGKVNDEEVISSNHNEIEHFEQEVNNGSENAIIESENNSAQFSESCNEANTKLELLLKQVIDLKYAMNTGNRSSVIEENLKEKLSKVRNKTKIYLYL